MLHAIYSPMYLACMLHVCFMFLYMYGDLVMYLARILPVSCMYIAHIASILHVLDVCWMYAGCMLDVCCRKLYHSSSLPSACCTNRLNNSSYLNNVVCNIYVKDTWNIRGLTYTEITAVRPVTDGLLCPHMQHA